MNEVRRKGKGPPSLRETGLVTCTREDGSGRVFQIGVIFDRAGVLALGRQIAVDEPDARHSRCVRCADARLDAPQIAAWPVRIARAQPVHPMRTRLTSSHL